MTKPVKAIARDLLERLKREVLVLDWWKKPWTREGVRSAIEDELEKLPRSYETPIWQQKVDEIFLFFYQDHPRGSVH